MMESSHAKPRPNRPPPIKIPRNAAPTLTEMSQHSTTLGTWVKEKLSIIPAMYSNYDEGMKAIKGLIQQDFAPRHHSTAMQAFYKEFYTIEAGPAETGAKLWSRWRYNCQKQATDLMGLHTPTNDSTAETQDAARLTTNGKSTASDFPSETSYSNGARVEQKRNSAIISEAEAKLLRNRGSNYWGDLATPVWPQSAGKAKVVYIRPKSSKPNASPEEQSMNTSQDATVMALTRDNSRNYRRNSLPALCAPFADGFGSVDNNPTLGDDQAVLEKANGMESQESKSATFGVTGKVLHGPAACLGAKVTYGDKHLPGPDISLASNTILGGSHSQYTGPYLHGTTLTSGAGTFGRGAKINLDLSEDRMPRSHCSWSDSRLPIQSVNQGHGTLGLNSPVESFIASPKESSLATDNRSFYLQKSALATRSPERLMTISPPTRVPSPSSVYSSTSNSSHKSVETDYDSQAFPKFHRIPLGVNLGGVDNQDESYQPSEMGLGRPPPKTPGSLHTEMSIWQGEPIPPLGKPKSSLHGQAVINSPLVTRSNCGEYPLKVTFGKETNEAPASPGATKKLRNSMQPPGLRVTKEVTQEEEKDAGGRFTRSTFTTHVPRFGRDAMKEIHKVHAKGDTKKPAFFRVIQDAVHDGISINKKTPSKTNSPDFLKGPLKSQGKLVNKMTISGPIHDGNPLQLSSSASTPNILLNALPITMVTLGVPGPSQPQGKLPITMPLNLQGKVSTPGAELLPWNDTTVGEDGSSSDEGETMAEYTPKNATPCPKAADTPAITIGPFKQAELYSWIECSVVQACSDFLKQQQTSLNLDHLKKEVKKWRNEEIRFATGEAKKRDQPLEFMFGMEVQCRLIEGSHKELVFSGPSAMNPITIINSWKHIIPSFSPRTFCFPDYLILEHLRIMEKVLNLFGTAYWDSKVYEKKRAEIVECIMNSGQVRKMRSAEEKMERLQKERERAEAQLLIEVGVWSTEESMAGRVLGKTGEVEAK